TEDGAVVLGSVAGNDSDVDDAYSSLSYSLNAPVAGLTLQSNGDYSFDPSNAAYQHLAAGQTTDVVAHYTVSDPHGAEDPTLTIHVTGVNDAPVALAISQDASEDGPSVTLTADFSDADTSDTHTFSIDTTGTIGDVTNNNDGTFTYDPNG